MLSERQKMASGDWFNCLDPELEALRVTARIAVHEHNTMSPDLRGAMAPKLRELFGNVRRDCLIEAPFHCAYGINISFGSEVYLNTGCTILDSARVLIGDQTMFGPNVQIYCANHHLDPALRAAGQEIALPITIGSRVWIGGGAIVLPGVNIGDDAIIGAGAVVTRDVGAGDTVVGNPASSLRTRD